MLTDRVPADQLPHDPFPALAELDLPSFGAALDDEFGALRRHAFEEGRQAGFERGRFEGHARGIVEGRSDASSEIGALRRSIEQAAAAFERRDAGLNAEVVDFALDIARAVLQRELTVSVDPGRDALIRAIDAGPERPDLVARLNPDDVELLGDISQLAPGRSVRIVADPAVAPGGCLLDAGSARVDADIPAALDRVRVALLGDPAALLDHAHEPSATNEPGEWS